MQEVFEKLSKKFDKIASERPHKTVTSTKALIFEQPCQRPGDVRIPPAPAVIALRLGVGMLRADLIEKRGEAAVGIQLLWSPFKPWSR